MFCKECGTQLSDDAQFCPNCGKEVVSSTPAKNTASNPPPKKKTIIAIGAGVVVLLLVATGIFLVVGRRTDITAKNETIEEDTKTLQEPVETESTIEKDTESENETVINTDYAFYAASLIDLLNESVLPNERIVKYIDEPDNYPIQFSIYDINSDGEEELLIKIPGIIYDIENQFIYKLNADHTGIEDLCTLSVDATYYDTGFIKEPVWNEKSLSNDFRPYDIKLWDAGGFLDAGRVEAWEKLYMPNDFSGNPFPDNVDSDNNGIVYFISGELGIDYEHPVDDAEYKEYEKQFWGDETTLAVPWKNLTIENIEKITGYTEERIKTEGIVPIYTGEIYDSELQPEEESSEMQEKIPYVPITTNVIGKDFELYGGNPKELQRPYPGYFANALPVIKNTDNVIYYMDMYSVIGVEDGRIVTYTTYNKDGIYNVEQVLNELGICDTAPYIVDRDHEEDSLIWKLDDAYLIMNVVIFNPENIKLLSVTITQDINDI